MRRQKNVCCFCKIKEIIKKKNYSDFYSIFAEKVIYLSEKERCLSEGETGKDVHMNKLDELKDLITALQKKKKKKKNFWFLAVLGAVAAVAGIAYAVYRYFTPDYLDDFDDDLDDDFDNYFDDEDEEDKETEE